MSEASARRRSIALLILASCAIVLVSISLTWSVVPPASGVGPELAVKGGRLVPLGSSAAMVGALAIVLMFSVGTVWNRVAGTVVTLVSVLAIVQTFDVLVSDLPPGVEGEAGSSVQLLPALAAVLGLVGLTAGGVSIVGAAKSWGGLSGRFERSSQAPAEGPRTRSDLWHELDEGRDPTSGT